VTEDWIRMVNPFRDVAGRGEAYAPLAGGTRSAGAAVRVLLEQKIEQHAGES
jgi:hypothetical protein